MVILDVAQTIDGYWADAEGASVYPIDEMHAAGLVQPLVERTGAAVLSRRSFEMVEDPDWYADNYELQVPLFVVTDHVPGRHPKENGKLRITFVDRFEVAFDRARASAGTKDVLVVGEASAVHAALQEGIPDEIFLRVVARTIGSGVRAFPSDGISADEYEIRDTSRTANAVHVHLRRRRKVHDPA